MKLDQKYFEKSWEFKALENILDSLNYIKPIKISRTEFNKKKWNILLEQKWDNSNIRNYILYLPDDLRINELPAIILRVNKATFWEKLPEYASTNELKIKLVLTIDRLLELLSKNDWKDRKDIERSIKKYLALYGQLFPEEKINNLNNRDYRKSILSTKNNDKYREYEEKLIRISTKEKISALLDDIEWSITKEIDEHFYESFFEEWMNMLRLWMMTITGAEQELIKWKKGEITIVLKKTKQSLDNQERLLRDKIWIDGLKKVLTMLRKTWNKELIEKKELDITNLILDTIFEYPYQSTKSDYGYQPNKIIKSKEIYCVWFSLLWHAFLSELWIKHNWLSLPMHSALEVIIWWKNYYFDWTSSWKALEFSYWEQVWAYKRIHLKDKSVKIQRDLAYSWDAEKILISHLYNNKYLGLDKNWKTTEAADISNKLSEIWLKDIWFYRAKWYYLSNQKKFTEAIKIYDQAIKINPKDASLYIVKWNVCFNIWKYGEAMECHDKAIEIEPENMKYYKSLNNLYNKLIEHNPKANLFNPTKLELLEKVYSIRLKESLTQQISWKIFEPAKLYKIKELYIYARDVSTWKESNIELLYRDEKRTIKNLINKGDYNSLRLFLLELEKDMFQWLE